MPNNTKRDAMARQWQLLKLLPSRGAGRSAKSLATSLANEGFKVTVRTVERDLIELSRLFPLDCNGVTVPQGWRWMANATLDLPSVAVSEALSLQLIAQYLKPLLPASILHTLNGRFQLAAQKLAALRESNPTSRWADKARSVSPSLALVPPVIGPGVLEAVQDALLADRQLDVVYRGADVPQSKALRLHPLGLVQRGPVTYLVARAFHYDDIRLFAVHRLVSAAGATDRARRPAGFSLDRYIASGAFEFDAGKRIRLVGKITPALARYLKETPLAENQRLDECADPVRLTVTIRHTWQLRWWILSQADAIQVLSPVSLRDDIERSLKGAALRYSDAT